MPPLVVKKKKELEKEAEFLLAPDYVRPPLSSDNWIRDNNGIPRSSPPKPRGFLN